MLAMVARLYAHARIPLGTPLRIGALARAVFGETWCAFTLTRGDVELVIEEGRAYVSARVGITPEVFERGVARALVQWAAQVDGVVLDAEHEEAAVLHLVNGSNTATRSRSGTYAKVGRAG